MAADRGRDLKVSIVSDVDDFTTDKPVTDLERLAKAGDEAKRELDRLDDATREAGRGAAVLEDGTDRASRSANRLGDEGRDTARKLGNAFDDIRRASRSQLKAVDDDLDDAAKGMDDFKDEAAGSGREAAASFSGEFSDITGAVQEIAANAFGGFGPLGMAAGIAAAAGIGIITKVFTDTKERAEESKARVKEFFDAFVEGQGKLSEEAVKARLQDLLGDPEQYEQLKKDATEARVSIELLARARSGDLDAVRAVAAQVRDHTKALDSNHHITTELESAQLEQRNALDRVSEGLGIARGEIEDANTAYNIFERATKPGIVTQVRVDAPTDAELRAEHRNMRNELARRVNVPVGVDRAAAREAAAAAYAAMQAQFRTPLTVRVDAKPGMGAGYGVVRPRP